MNPPLRRSLSVLAVALLLAGCAPSTRTEVGTSDGEGVVGIALPDSDDLAARQLGDALGDELRARGFRVDLEFAAADDRTQTSQVQNMVTKGEDAVVLVPISGDVLADARAATGERAVPLIAAGRELDDAEAVRAVDPAALGQAQAEALLDALGDRGESAAPASVALLGGVADDPDAAAAHAAAVRVLAPAVDAGTLRILDGADIASAAVAEAPAEVESAAEGRTRNLRAESDGSSPDAVLALGDAVSRGVVAALTTPDPEAAASPSPTASADPESVSRPPLLVIASGGDASTVTALRDGIVAATVFVDTRAWAGPIADAVTGALRGDTPSPGSAEAPTTVDRDAVESVFLESGWLSPDDLVD